MRDYEESKALDFLAAIIVMCGLAFVFWLVLTLLSGIPCSVKAKAQSMEYKYGLIMGCMVKYKGEWVDYDRLRYVGE